MDHQNAPFLFIIWAEKGLKWLVFPVEWPVKSLWIPPGLIQKLVFLATFLRCLNYQSDSYHALFVFSIVPNAGCCIMCSPGRESALFIPSSSSLGIHKWTQVFTNGPCHSATILYISRQEYTLWPWPVCFPGCPSVYWSLQGLALPVLAWFSIQSSSNLNRVLCS